MTTSMLISAVLACVICVLVVILVTRERTSRLRIRSLEADAEIVVLARELTTESTVDAQTQHWRDRCLQLQLAEGYVARQAQNIIDEYSVLVTEALTQVVAQAQAVLSATASAANTARFAEDSIKMVAQNASAADEVLDTLTESLRLVDGITEFIASVAGKTNLLALNASIEAARAGDAGLGFAVVAHEVKELATATAQSATKISHTVDSLGEQASRVASVIRGMVDGVTNVGDAVAGVAGGMGEQQTSLEELDLRVNDVMSQMELLSMLVRSVDRRVHPRVAAVGTVGLLCGSGEVQADLLDLSEGGMRCAITRSTALEVGTSVRVSISTADEVLQLNAIARRRIPSGQRDHLGLEFVDISASQQQVLAGEIATLLSTDESTEETGR
jgi:methyl-accepting chemotaxis protein